MTLRILAIAGCVLLMACGGGGLQLEPQPEVEQSTYLPPAVQPVVDAPVPVAGTEMPAPEQPTNKLVLNVPAVNDLAPGAEFEVSLSGIFLDEVYQGSMRILFDPAYIVPVQAERGGLLLDDMIYLAGLDKAGFVPFAFTGLPGHQSMEPGAGDLLRVRFRVLQPAQDMPRIKLQNDTEFLQIRNRSSQRLPFDLESRAGVQR